MTADQFRRLTVYNDFLKKSYRFVDMGLSPAPLDSNHKQALAALYTEISGIVVSCTSCSSTWLKNLITLYHNYVAAPVKYEKVKVKPRRGRPSLNKIEAEKSTIKPV